ncbi:PocR ligand-binding domain-containing protein [Anaerolineales bacterium HSG24]|nr:PocR ligand-binding domain-containing protein [Anaerolineales bacterium HSG24]
MKITELINIDELQELCEDFTTVTGAVTALLDLEGNVLIATGWQDICTQFHRVHSETEARCLESDTILASQLKRGERYNVYKCKNGLVDVAVPIMIGDEHVANFFTGQFFFEPPDRKYFIRQAEEFGFDQPAYLAALERVPIFSEERIKAIMSFFSRLAHLIGKMGLAQKEQMKKSKELEIATQEIIAAQQQVIQELSIPVIPVMDQIIVLPLIGNIDSERAREIMRSVLDGISQHRAKVVILDVTGVAVMDTEVVDHLNKTIQAARLKGARTIITGISDAVAEAVVDLGIDWDSVTTLGDLQTGLMTALRSLGIQLKHK